MVSISTMKTIEDDPRIMGPGPTESRLGKQLGLGGAAGNYTIHCTNKWSPHQTWLITCLRRLLLYLF
eukprot:scaffold32121_cov79-Attheya_sp.AAC.2